MERCLHQVIREVTKLKQWDTTHLSALPRSRMLTTPTAGEDVSNMNSHSLLAGIQNHKDSLEVSYKTKHTLTIWLTNRAPSYLPKGLENLRPHKNLHMDVYSSFIYNCQNLKATKVSFGRKTDELWISKQWNTTIQS